LLLQRNNKYKVRVRLRMKFHSHRILFYRIHSSRNLFLGFISQRCLNPVVNDVNDVLRNADVACDQSVPLGMISGEIKDWQLSTSSTYPSDWDRTCHERYARLYQPNGHAWCAKYKTSSEWLQIDLGVAAKVRPLESRT